MSTRHLVDPDLLPMIDAFPPADLTDATLPDFRRFVANLVPAEETYRRADVRISRCEIAGAAGEPDIPVTLYRPSHPRILPVVLHVHGGGYVAGSAAVAGPWCVELAADVGCLVASVDYRLAPEAIAPKAVLDCYSVLRWLHAAADRLGVDPCRIAIAGESAGGGLAAATAIYARDQREYALCHQSLMYPMLDDRTVVAPSPNPHVGEFVWTPANNAYGWRSYLGCDPGARDIPPYSSPGRECNLAGLPPAYIAVGALDLFLEEATRYSRDLLRAGVPVDFNIVAGAVHGFDVASERSSALSVRNQRKHSLAKAFSQEKARELSCL